MPSSNNNHKHWTLGWDGTERVLGLALGWNMRFDKGCIRVGMRLSYVSGNDRSGDNEMFVVW